MSGVFPYGKNPGETLAVLLRRFREEHGLSMDDKLTYAGRLDPMAEGIVPILVGEARFQKDHMLRATKTYEVDILLGISTDTGDMLGCALPRHSSTEGRSEGGATKSIEEIKKALSQLSLIKELPYPHYSSRPVDGTPLFMHARAGRKVAVPIKKVTIHSLELEDIKEVPLKKLLDDAIAVIKKVQGDFRQEEIVAQWATMREADSDFAIATTDRGNLLMTIVTIRATVSSGTYMRSLAEKLGELLGLPALAYRIKRTAIEGVE